jgi:hypothetical protein
MLAAPAPPTPVLRTFTSALYVRGDLQARSVPGAHAAVSDARACVAPIRLAPLERASHATAQNDVQHTSTSSPRTNLATQSGSESPGCGASQSPRSRSKEVRISPQRLQHSVDER